MRIISLHPASLAVGLVLGCITLLSMSQASSHTSTRIEIGPLPRDMVQVQEGVPFTVPPGRIFVLTALGTNAEGNSSELVSLLANAVVVARSSTWLNGSAAPLSVASVPRGQAIGAGSVISVVTSSPAPFRGQAWGFLDSAQPSKLSRVPHTPRAADLVQIHQGTPYIVPPGKLFVLTALGSTSGGSAWDEHALRVNGQQMLVGVDPGLYAHGPIAEAPEGFTVPTGVTIEVVPAGGAPTDGVAWGYLAAE